MTFTERLIKDSRVQACYEAYLKHPFVRGMLDGTLPKDKYKRYLIQDTHYLKDYSKVFAYCYVTLDKVKDLQFLHTCIGVVMSEETNMHIQYLKDFDLDVFMIESLEEEPATREYLNYMLQFKGDSDAGRLFCAALPCTLSYEFIGKSLKKQRDIDGGVNYYDAWIAAYAGEAFEDFSIRSVELIDELAEGKSEETLKEWIEIFIKACEYEMNFWDMSYGKGEVA
jgi:thiaminase/transcriptional activator TenA